MASRFIELYVKAGATMRVAIDNQNVIQASQAPMGGNVTDGRCEVWAELARRTSAHIVLPYWCPAHSRHPEWSPPPSTGDARRWRRLNDAADKRCTEELRPQRVNLNEYTRVIEDAARRRAPSPNGSTSPGLGTSLLGPPTAGVGVLLVTGRPCRNRKLKFARFVRFQGDLRRR